MLTDAVLQDIFRWILENDSQCLLSDRTKRYGSEDPAVAWVMAGYLVTTVHVVLGETISAARARNIVRGEFAARRERATAVAAFPGKRDDHE